MMDAPLNTQGNFYINQKIKVKDGIKDPDYGFDIGGWMGVVENISLGLEEETMCHILWDKSALKAMGKTFKRKSEEDNLDFERMILGESELTAT